MVEHAREHDYTIVAYSPLAGGEIFDVPEIRTVAEKHGTTPAVVSIAWVLSHEEVVTIPKASSREHLEANLTARELTLEPEDIARIDGIEREVELFPE